MCQCVEEKNQEKKRKGKYPHTLLSFQMSYSHAQLGFISKSQVIGSLTIHASRSQVEEEELKGCVLLIAPPYGFVTLKSQLTIS